MQRRSLRLAPALALILIGLPVSGARASEDLQILPSVGPLGPIAETVSADPAIDGGPGLEAGRDATLLWHRYLPDPIYTSVGLTQDDVFAGDYLNPPKEAELIPIFGDGTPDWVYSGTEFYVDTARDADVLAALDANAADSTVTVGRWSSGSSAPIWQYTIHHCRPLTGEGWSAGKGIQVDDSGHTIAVVVNSYDAAGLRGHLLLFAPSSGVPITEVPLAGSASALAVNQDGNLVAVYAWPSIYVYDRTLHDMRWTGNAVSGNDAIAISGDGSYIAWGWSNLYLRHWDGATYQPLWQTSKTGYYVTECAMTLDGDKLAVAWYRGTTYDDTILEMYSLPDHSLLWAYDYASPRTGGAGERGGDPATQTSVDVVSEMVFSQTGDYLAACSWGPYFPEIQVFLGPDPVAVLDTPGTMFDIDIWGWWDTPVYVAACGKHVHAGISGRGADLYLLRVATGGGVAEGPTSSSPAGLWIRPNPLRGEGRIDYTMARGGTVRLMVVDPAGRMIARLLDAVRGPGPHTAVWDGRDEAGRAVPSGSYFLRLQAGADVESRRVLLIR